MELLRPDFKITNVQNIFNSKEIELIESTVNGWPLPKDEGSIKVSIMKKVGVKGWARTIAMLFKLGVVSNLCLILTLTLSVNSVLSPEFETQRVQYRPVQSRSKSTIG